MPVTYQGKIAPDVMDCLLLGIVLHTAFGVVKLTEMTAWRGSGPWMAAMFGLALGLWPISGQVTSTLGTASLGFSSILPIVSLLEDRGVQHPQATIEATVTSQIRPGTVFLRDDTGAILALLATNGSFQAGDRLRVTGMISSNGFSPYFVQASAALIGQTKPPVAIGITVMQGQSGRFDGELVTLQARLLSPVEKYGDTWTLRLASQNHPFRADLVDHYGTETVTELEPRSVLRITGVCSVGASEGSKKDFRLIVNRAASIQVLSGPPWLSLDRAIRLLMISLLVALTVFIWVFTLQRRVKEQTRIISEQASGHAANLERTVKERTASLKQAVEDMEVFAAGVSHDLRSPLRTIKSFCDLIIYDHSSALPAEVTESLNRISNSADRLNRLIEDLLTYSRVASARITLEEVDLERILDDVRHDLPTLQKESALIQIDAPLSHVRGHINSVRRALENLLLNAVKFARPTEKPQIRIWTEQRDAVVRVSIKDEGIGIRPEDKEKIFGIFERLNPTVEGTGIGLAIVKRSIEKMGGRVGVDSELNQGALFWFELPPA